MNRFTLALFAAVVVGCAGPASAATVSPVRYDMPNGDGQSSGGTFNYWDRNYTGSGATTVDNSPLSGGLGKLTDGVVATQFWFNVSNNDGTGEYVGWLRRTPAITFFFDGSPTIEAVTIHYDNSRAGGVAQPATLIVGSTGYAIPNSTTPSVGSFTVDGLSLTGPQLTLRFLQNVDTDFPWIFVSEVAFAGAPGAIPEPSTYALLIGGLLVLGAMARSRVPRT